MKPLGASAAPRSLSGAKGQGSSGIWPASPNSIFRLNNLTDADLVRQARAGNEEAINHLFRRHWEHFLAQAREHCGACGWVEDVCQQGCLKALARLGSLERPEAFHSWVSGFIAHERRHCSRSFKESCKIVGTLGGPDGTYQVERLGVAPQEWVAPDRNSLWSALWQEAGKRRGRTRRVAVLMLEFYVENGQFPAVRVVAEQTRSTHGGAERSRVAMMRAWRRKLASLGLHP